MAQIIPVSQDPERFVSRTVFALPSSMLTMSSQDRFVELANAFFSGRYAESLTKENLFSTHNAFMLHSSWLAVLDLGDLILKQSEGKVGT